jgi:hypothetical protein
LLPGIPGHTFDVLSKAKIALVMENGGHYVEGYVTEKLRNGFLSGAVPVSLLSRARVAG